MNIYLINLMRLVHVVGGVLWVGAAALYLFMITPSVKATAPASMKFLQYFIVRKKYPAYMGISSTLTILSGAVLVWFSSGGQLSAWITTGPGLGFTIGALASLATVPIGFGVISPRAGRIGALSTQIEVSGGPPSQEQLAELARLDHQLHTAEVVDFVLLAIALVTMATARYWFF
jgi:uncharacterized membrane protein